MADAKDGRSGGGRYVATESSLKLAQMIAERMGIPFDKARTAALSDNLYETMYGELLDLLDLRDQGPRFESGAYSSARLFLSQTGEREPIIVLDMVFDFWVEAATHLTSIATFRAMPIADARKLTDTFEKLFDLFLSANRFHELRTEMAPYYLDFTDELRVSSVLARAMIVFALCHEIAHALLGHQEEEASPAQELAADGEAVRLYLELCGQQERARQTHVYLDPKIAGGPLVFMSILSLLEDWMLARGGVRQLPSTHPPASERLTRIHGLLWPNLNETAQSLVSAHGAALGDIRTLMDIG